MQMPWSSFLIFSTVFTFTVSLPTNTTVPSDATPSIPREFPNFNQNYTFVDNSSIRENLASHDAAIDTEVDDLLGKDEEKSGRIAQEEEVVEANPSEQEEDTGRKSAVEWIENGDDTEDNKFDDFTTIDDDFTSEENTLKSTMKKATETKESSLDGNEESTQRSTITVTEIKELRTEESSPELLEPYKDGVPVLDGTVAAVLVGIFLVICIFGYTALILWRRSLELKYGSREMLVDKDDMFDPDDMKHFSI